MMTDHDLHVSVLLHYVLYRGLTYFALLYIYRHAISVVVFVCSLKFYFGFRCTKANTIIAT